MLLPLIIALFSKRYTIHTHTQSQTDCLATWSLVTNERLLLFIGFQSLARECGNAMPTERDKTGDYLKFD
jgi:hypothetical protein